MDIIFLEQLRTSAIVGIYDWERCIPQTIIIDLEMGVDNRAAAATDTIENTLNYKKVTKRILEFVENSSFHLVETLAENVASLVREEFDVPWLRLSVSKPGALRHVRNVGITIERGDRG